MPRATRATSEAAKQGARERRVSLATTTLKRAGGSLVMTVPVRARDALGLSAGDTLSVAVEGQRLVLEPAVPARPRYTLAQLLAEEKAAKIRPATVETWSDAPPKGREIW